MFVLGLHDAAAAIHVSLARAAEPRRRCPGDKDRAAAWPGDLRRAVAAARPRTASPSGQLPLLIPLLSS